jgi:thioredoxin-related protein
MKRRAFVAGMGAATLLAARGAGAQARVEPVPLDEGRLTQSWFLNSFLALKDDLADAAAQGKRLAIFWDQRGCPYCQEMHRVNFADPAVNAFVRERFACLQLDLFGSREVTDFDGQVMTEKDLARKYAIAFTPTVQFLPPDVAGIEGKTGRALEVARMPGYFRPGHFEAMFAFVHERAYERDTFQKFLRARAG